MVTNSEAFEYVFEHYFGAYNDRTWRSLFGVSKDTICYVWENIQPVAFERKHLLMALNYLKLYELTDVAHLRWQVAEKTWRKYVWKVLHHLAAKLNTIPWNDRTSLPSLFGHCYAVVDVTLAPVQVDMKDREWQGLFWSVKHKMHGLKYEIIVSVNDGRILWIGGPVGGRIHDITLLRWEGILDDLSFLEYLLGDKGYEGEQSIWVPFKGKDLDDFELQWNHFINSFRVIVENVIARLKKFGFLQRKWKNDIMLHETAFKVAANLINIEFLVSPVRAQ